MNKIHRTLHLQPHNHTGKVLHHRHTSYRGLAVVIGLAGLFIAGLNVAARVTADSLYVYATVPAPLPTTAATITAPASNTTIYTSTVTVNGTCEVLSPAVVVVITDNGNNVGSVVCDSSGTFGVNITLAGGEQSLIAKSSSITSGAGPDSPSVHITVVLPAVPVTPTPPATTQTIPDTSTPATNTNATQPADNSGDSPETATIWPDLVVQGDEQFIVYGPSKDAIWTGTIYGGKAPYTVRVWWGDSTMNTYRTIAGSQRFRHHFSTLESYDTKMTVTDSRTESEAAGSVHKVTQHIAVVTPYKPPSAAATSLVPGSGGIFGKLGPNSLVGAYGSYLLLLALFGLLWARAHHGFAYAKVPATHRRTSGNRPPVKTPYVAAKRRKQQAKKR